METFVMIGDWIGGRTADRTVGGALFGFFLLLQGAIVQQKYTNQISVW